jgi:D-alanyl-D-alanine endopeptidase (penicillin-binding protein 7)
VNFSRVIPPLCAVLLLSIATGFGALAGERELAVAMAPQGPWSGLDPSGLALRSKSVLVVDDVGNRLYGKNTLAIKPIASITKLMTAMVVLDAGLDMDANITISSDDRDDLRHSRSRMRVNRATLPRSEMLMIALMSSENRAAAALARTTYPGGTPVFVKAMNRKARALGMNDSHFADATGLDSGNRSTAEDLVRLVRAAAAYPLIRQLTTRVEAEVQPYAGGGVLPYRNTNPLVRNGGWDVELSKTGYTDDAGRCLVMQVKIAGQRLHIVLLDSSGKLSPVGDSNRLRKWIEAGLGVRTAGSG